MPEHAVILDMGNNLIVFLDDEGNIVMKLVVALEEDTVAVTIKGKKLK